MEFSLAIFPKAATFFKPTKCTLNNPTFRQYFELVKSISLYHLNCSTVDFDYCTGKFLTRVREMENTICDSPIIETQMLQLARELKTVSGKKVYGYLKKPLKEQVDAIVDELAKVSAVAECYHHKICLKEQFPCHLQTPCYCPGLTALNSNTPAHRISGNPARTPCGAGPSSIAEPVFDMQMARGTVAAALIAP